MSANTAVTQIIVENFPDIHTELLDYVEGVLQDGDDFNDESDIYDAVGGVLEEVGNGEKGDEDIMLICSQLLNTLKNLDKEDYNENGVSVNLPTSLSPKTLDAPVNLKSVSENDQRTIDADSSIWLIKRDESLKVDQKKLEKAEAKIKQKQERRGLAPTTESASNGLSECAATTSQATNRKETKMEASGTNKSLDFKLENCDIAFGEKVLLRDANLSIIYGRRYGLVGRNGIGKTTLLRMVASGQLRIPSHIRILHVEQEVVGDETVALASVLECDERREALLREERELNEKIHSSSAGTDTGLSHRLQEVYSELEHMEADKAPARAAIILSGLGFTPQMQSKTTKEFSGGWRMRLALARALFTIPDLLLLDEPTNMLDMKAIIWLENYLQQWSSTLLVVSHDRNFLDAVTSDIIHMHSQRLDIYHGNYENFLKTKTEKLKNQQREYESQQQYRAHLQAYIDRWRYNANRAPQAQMRIKILEKLPELKPVEKESIVVLKFPEPEALSPPILQLDDADFYYDPQKPIFNKICVGARMDSRICIVGDNGAGKTTLLRLLLGELSPTSGLRHAHRSLTIGYFSQHHVDQLDMNVSSLELIAQRFPNRGMEAYRHQLGSYGVTGDLALRSVASLSGGQKSRVAFALLTMTRPHLYILDEPTNHLDMETIEALGKALNKFEGGVVLVSHDERLIRNVCKELWLCENNTIRVIEGGFDEYKKTVETELSSMR